MTFKVQSTRDHKNKPAVQQNQMYSLITTEDTPEEPWDATQLEGEGKHLLGSC